MIERNITITLEKAKEWLNSGNTTLKKIALQAFNEKELACSFKNITTFKDACDVLGLNYGEMLSIINHITPVSKASAAMFELNIIRKALNLDQDLRLTKSPKDSFIYYPKNPLLTRDSVCYIDELRTGEIAIIGRIKSEGKEYNVLGGSTSRGGYDGLGSFYPLSNVNYAYDSVGFLGCANKEIAEHLGRYFGMLITEAKYGDLPDFEIVERRYDNY